MIQVENVTKRFYNVTALHNVSLTIGRGEVTGILGPNGAGKSTLFRIIAGLVNPDRGRIVATGNRWPALSYKPDRLIYPNEMIVRDYLRMFADLCELRGSAARTAIDGGLERVGLSNAADKRIAVLSKGMRQRLGLAQALIGDPELLLLDEPTNGLDPSGQAELRNQIRQLQQDGKTILMSSHQLHEVTDVCTQLIIIGNGHVRYANSTAQALTVRPQIEIEVDRDLKPMAPWLRALHPAITLDANRLYIGEEAVELRRKVLTLLLGAGYDILHIEYSRVTLAEIYAEAVQ